MRNNSPPGYSALRNPPVYGGSQRDRQNSLASSAQNEKQYHDSITGASESPVVPLRYPIPTVNWITVESNEESLKKGPLASPLSADSASCRESNI
jgi:hypothetical protein